MADGFDMQVYVARCVALNEAGREMRSWYTLTLQFGNSDVRQSTPWPEEILVYDAAELVGLVAGAFEDGTEIMKHAEQNATGVTVSGTFHTWDELRLRDYEPISEKLRLSPITTTADPAAAESEQPRGIPGGLFGRG